MKNAVENMKTAVIQRINLNHNGNRQTQRNE